MKYGRITILSFFTDVFSRSVFLLLKAYDILYC